MAGTELIIDDDYVNEMAEFFKYKSNKSAGRY